MSNRHPSPAPVLSRGDAVVLFDGTCKLCNGWAKFIIDHDRRHRIILATVQSPEGQELLGWAGLPQEEFNTIVFIEGDQFFVRSAAMFEINARLPWTWQWLGMARAIPRPFRDWMYDKIALNRYRIFGRYDSFRTPGPDHPTRFLAGK
jgi:predicted DCC family thiol-disulfide oxidoreductase YuxK